MNRTFDIQEIKSLPYIPLSHLFVERLTSILLREMLNQTLFWNAADLERKLADFQYYYNTHLTHCALNGTTPYEISEKSYIRLANLSGFSWKSHCNGLFQLPEAA